MLRPFCVCLEVPERSSLSHTQSQSRTSRQCQHCCICSLQLRHANTASVIFDGSLLALVLKEWDGTLKKVHFIDATSKCRAGGFVRNYFVGIIQVRIIQAMLLLIFEPVAFCEIIWDHFPRYRGMCAWAGDGISLVLTCLHCWWATLCMRFRPKRSCCSSQKHLNPQLNKPVEYIYLCDHGYASLIPGNIFLIYMVFFCLQLVYLVSVLGLKDFGTTGFTQKNINGCSTAVKEARVAI